MSDYVLSQPGAENFLDDYERVLRTVISGYLTENKVHATVAIGCTGGRHRSVATVEALAARLSDLDGIAVNVRHRDLDKE